MAPEPQHRQQRRQHPPVMIRIRPPQHSADLALEHRLVGLCLPDQFPQGLFTHHREHGLPDRLIRACNRCLGEFEQQRRLPTDPLQILGQLLLDLPHRAGIDLQHQDQQQIDQAVSDLRRTLMTQRRQERQAHRRRRVMEIRWIHPRRPRPPRTHDLLRHPGEQTRRKSKTLGC